MSETNDGNLDPAFGRIGPNWDESRTQRNLAATSRRMVHRRRLRVVAGSALLAVALAGGAYRIWHAPGLRGAPATATHLESESADGQRQIRFGDGSTVLLFDDRSHLAIENVTAQSIAVSLTSGMAHFDVVPSPARSFSVQVDAVTVRVLGTRFNLERDSGRVRVTVERGRVQATWPQGQRVLSAGQSGWFPDAPVPVDSGTVAGLPIPVEERPAAAAAGEEGQSKRAGAPSATQTLRTRFREHAKKGEYAEAYRTLAAAPQLVDNTAEDLLLAADAARLSGHPNEALPYLQRLLDKHARDQRAPLAAFTLGRILLSELGRPTEAADAFLLTRRLVPDGPLAQDALAREVEAANKAGAHERARRLAEEYRGRYPSGRRLGEVRRYGGI
jgi:transmembrane sensor